MREIKTINDFLVNDYDYIFSKINNQLSQLNNKTLLITGITGFVGKNILRTIIEHKKDHNLNISIIGISRNPTNFLAKYPEFQNTKYLSLIQAEIINARFINQIQEILKHNGNIDYIIHSATDTSNPQTEAEAHYQFSSIVQGTNNILKLASLYKIKKVLHMSSGAVYGFNKDSIEDFNEDIDIHKIIENETHAYRDGKRIAEKLIEKSGTDYIIARGFTFFGQYLDLKSHFAIGNFLNHILNGENIRINGDGKSIRSYLHSSDMLIYLFHMLLSKVELLVLQNYLLRIMLNMG